MRLGVHLVMPIHLMFLSNQINANGEIVIVSTVVQRFLDNAFTRKDTGLFYHVASAVKNKCMTRTNKEDYP